MTDITWRTVAIAAVLSVIVWVFLEQSLLPMFMGQPAPTFDLAEFVKKMLMQPIWFLIWVWLAIKIEQMKIL